MKICEIRDENENYVGIFVKQVLEGGVAAKSGKRGLIILSSFNKLDENLCMLCKGFWSVNMVKKIQYWAKKIEFWRVMCLRQQLHLNISMNISTNQEVKQLW